MAKEKEHGVTPFHELTHDDPQETPEGYDMKPWQEEEVGRPMRGRTKKVYEKSKSVYDMFDEHEEIGDHFTRSGSPGGAERDPELKE